jgi:hypothetical protein
LTATLEIMKLTDDHKVQLFCAALTATIQAEGQAAAASGPHTGSKVGAPSAVEKASLIAGEAIAKLQSKAWD